MKQLHRFPSLVFPVCLALLTFNNVFPMAEGVTQPEELQGAYTPMLSGNTKEYNFEVTYAYDSPDCVQKSIIKVNGQYPGPTIDVMRGDRVIVNVLNSMYGEGLVIHMHGIFQKGTPWMDGHPYVSQCPIETGDTFTYNFTVPDQVGTFWWHGHLFGQRTNGLYGAFIVRPNPAFGDSEPFSYDDEFVLLLNDWYHKPVFDQLVGLDIPLPDTFVFIGEPQSLLLNGRGRYNCSLLLPLQTTAPYNQTATTSQPALTPDINTCNLTSTDCQPNTVVGPLEAGKTYRLRIINVAALSQIGFAIEGHNLTIVAVDSNYNKPITVNVLDTWSAMRFDVLLTADQPIKNYWITTAVRGRPPATPPGTWTLSYKGAPNNTTPSSDPAPIIKSIPVWNDTAFSVLQQRSIVAYPGTNGNRQMPKSANRLFQVLGSQNRYQGRIRWPINGVVYENPRTPLLHSIYLNIPDGYTSNILPSFPTPSYDYVNVVGSPVNFNITGGQGVFEVRQDDVVQLVLQNGVPLNNRSDPHPWHLHGHDFWYLGSGLGNYNDSTDPWTNFNTVDPPLRSTIGVPPGGWTAIRVLLDNPGPWAFHCHIESHAHMGMMFVFNVQPTSGPLPAPPPGVQTCGLSNFACTP